MKTYQQLDALLTGRCHSSKKLGNNTYAVRHVETVGVNGNARLVASIAVRLHQTDVVTFHQDGRVVLNSGGWKTSTTKARINEHSPVQLWQHKGVWTFSQCGKSYTFADGVTIHTDGSVTGFQPEDKQDTDKKLVKAINKFAKLAGEKCPLPLPGAGDCFYCGMVTDSGSSLGEATKDIGHLMSHMDEGYVVPSLVLRALDFSNCGNLIKQAAFNQGAPSDYLNELAKSYVPRAVRKYLKRQFGLA